jgi:hypothetical protein
MGAPNTNLIWAIYINTFDSIYTSPLLNFRAFRRSAVVSTMIWSLVLLVPWFASIFSLWHSPMMFRAPLFRMIIPDLIISLLVIIFTDYISLLFARRFLDLARRRPISTSIMASVVGMLVILIGYMLFTVAIAVLGAAGLSLSFDTTRDSMSNYVEQSFEGDKVPDYKELPLLNLLLLPLSFKVMAPALIIHLWLPLFALSTLIARLVFWIFRAVEKAQWFLKQGDAHPLKAIGIVAIIIVFGSAMLVKEGWALLSVLERS